MEQERGVPIGERGRTSGGIIREDFPLCWGLNAEKNQAYKDPVE